MAKAPGNTIGPVTPFNPIGVAVTRKGPYLPPIARDPVPPPIVSVILPSPRVLRVTAAKPTSNQIPLTAAKPGDPEPYIFGRCLCEPILLTANDGQSNLYIDVLWSVGECDYIEYLVYENVKKGRGDLLGHIQHFEGAPGVNTSTFNAEMLAAFGASYDLLEGKCHSVFRRRPGRDSFNFSAMIRGLKLFDPRTSPGVTAYSTNPALCLSRILTDCGYTMDWTSVGDAADYCDEMIGSPTQKRWEIGLQIKDRQSLRNWVETFATYANCLVELQGGNAYLIADKPRASNHTVTAADMIAGTVSVSRAGGRNVPERVTVNYRPITEAGSPTWYVAAEGRTAETATTAEAGTTSVLQLPGIQTYSRARRMATMIYNRSRNDLALEYTGFDDGIQRTAGDVGTITNSQFGLSAATMTLIENTPIGRGRWRRRYIDYDASNYSDALYTEPAYNQVSLQNPNEPPDGPTPTLTQENYTDLSGDHIRIKIVFTGIAWPYMVNYKVTATGDDTFATVVYDGFVTYAGVVTHTLYSTDVVVGVTYTVDVQCHSVTDVYGTAGTADITIVAADILWSVTPLTISNLDDGTDSIFSPKAAAALTFWDYAYEFPDCTAATYQINPATFGSERLISHDFLTGEYIVKYVVVDTTSPAAIPPTVYVDSVAGQQSVWYDLFQTEIRIQDTVDDASENTVVLDITVAKANGSSPQGPVVGTEKTKRCTFIADYGDEPYILDAFTAVNGTDIDTTTHFTTMFGDPEVQSNTVKGGSTASPAHSSGDHAATTNSTWSLFSDAKCQIRISFGATTGTFGILGRQAAAPNAGNCWQLVITAADTANPILSLQEMTGSGKAMAVNATRATIILTGAGPFSGAGSGSYEAATMELEMVGTSITGRFWTPMIGVLYTVNYTSSTYQTQTRWGFRLSGVNDGWIDDFKIYPLEPYPVTAKHLNPSASPGNYYRSTQYNGLIPASGSGDTWIDMTLVFCVYVNAYGHVALFDDPGHYFFIRCSTSDTTSPEAPGAFYFGGREALTGNLRGVFLDATGSPSSGSIWPKNSWHSIMISVNGNLVSSPNSSVVTIWADGAQVYSGGYNVGYTVPNYPQWEPMGKSTTAGPFAGHGPSGLGFLEGGLDCYLSYVWCAETALDPAIYWSKFFDANNKPKWIGAQGEDVYGTIPASYFPHGNFTNNLGSGPDWTEVGTVADAPSSPSD